MTKLRHYRLEELKVGMQIIDKNQLSNIYDTWVILTRLSDMEPYTIEFIGRETNEESDRLFAQNKKICPVYNSSLEVEGDICYEE